MPSRPSAARRRFHRERVIAKRIAQARLLGRVEAEVLRDGRVANEQWYLGCHRPRCGVCHPSKRWAYGERQRSDREWRRTHQLGWGPD
jgi:hypothetical protein